jgi:outer membrane protein assembly factor BamB
LWTNKSLPYNPGSPVVAKGTIVTEAASALVGLDPETGEIVWKEKGRYRNGGSSTLASDGGSLYVFDGSDLVKLDAGNRSRVWQTSFEELFDSGLEASRPAVTDSTVYVGFRYVDVAGLTAEGRGVATTRPRRAVSPLDRTDRLRVRMGGRCCSP